MTWQESTLVWWWKSWIQMKPQSRASGCPPSGKVNFHYFSWDLFLKIHYSRPKQLFLSVLDFRRRFLSLLSYQFSSFHPSLALSILQNKKSKEEMSSKTRLRTLLIWYQHLSEPELTCLWPPQHSVAPSWPLISALMTSNVWSCIRGAWWTITSSWTWSQPWHARSSSSNSVKFPSQLHSV